MNILKETIQQLNKEEVRLFKIYASRFNEHDSRKDILLFDLYRKGTMSEEAICLKIYGTGGRNAFYRLKNRLLEEITKLLVIHHARDVSQNLPHFYLSLYHYYLSRQHYPLAENYLKKAEKAAGETEQHDLLDMIYGEFIKLSRELFHINPEHFISIRKENFDKLSHIRQMDEIIAVLSYRLTITQNLGLREEIAPDLYERVVNEFQGDPELMRMPLFRIRVYKVISQVLIGRRDYPALRQYLLRTFNTFAADRVFNRNTHETKVQMLIYLVNTFNELKEYTAATGYSEQLKEALAEFGGLLYSKYIYFYYQGLVASYQRTDTRKAIDTLQHMLKSKELRANPYYEIFTYSNLAFLHFNNGDYRQVTKNIHRIYLNPDYPKTDISLKIRIAIVELISRYELHDPELFEYRVDQLRKDFSDVNKSYHMREFQLIDILDKMSKSRGFGKDRVLRKSVQKFFDGKDVNDTELIDYNEWLRKKIKIT